MTTTCEKVLNVALQLPGKGAISSTQLETRSDYGSRAIRNYGEVGHITCIPSGYLITLYYLLLHEGDPKDRRRAAQSTRKCF